MERTLYALLGIAAGYLLSLMLNTQKPLEISSISQTSAWEEVKADVQIVTKVVVKERIIATTTEGGSTTTTTDRETVTDSSTATAIENSSGNTSEVQYSSKSSLPLNEITAFVGFNGNYIPELREISYTRYIFSSIGTSISVTRDGNVLSGVSYRW